MNLNKVLLVICSRELLKVSKELQRRWLMGEVGFKKGDIIAVKRWGGVYEHYGVYVGDDKVIQFSAMNDDFGGNITIHESSVEEFLRNDLYYYKVDFEKWEGKIYSAEETVNRAKKMIEKNEKYDLLTNNCEHFARWCKTGKKISTQVEIFKYLISINRLNQLGKRSDTI